MSTADIDDRKDDLLELLEQNEDQARIFWEKLEISWVYHENALEGVVITPEEMSLALRASPPPGVTENGKLAFLAGIRRQKEAIALAREEALNPKGRITLALLKSLFETLTGGEGPKGKFEYRKDMPLHRTYFHEIAQPPRITGELNTLIDWTSTPEYAELTVLQQAALFHHRFMGIFPFTELSGKVGRLVMNIGLMRAGYMPAVINGIDRQRYFESLKQQPRQLQTLMTEAIEHTTEHGFKFFAPPDPEEGRWYRAG